MKKLILYVLVVCSIFANSKQCYADTCAKAAIVMDVNTGRVLYSKNIHQKLPMASTTKIMTTITAIESNRLNEYASVSKKASYQEGSSIYLKQGEKLKVEELLYGIMLRSGNDASVAVAEHIGGSVEGFVDIMNEKAKQIGAKNTNFCNPHGLPNDNHYTTAYDLALITSYSLKNILFSQIVKTKHKTIQGPPNESFQRSLTNKNKMLWQFDGADGVKTGYTTAAGRCLVSSATKDGMRLVCVVLNCDPMWEDSTTLLEYGFKTYSNTKVVDKKIYKNKINVDKGKSKDINIIPQDDFYVPLKENEIEKIKYITELNDAIAPIEKGMEAGNLNIFLGDQKLGSIKLLYSESIMSNNPIYYIKKIFTNIN